jgi:rhamnosyltransferase
MKIAAVVILYNPGEEVIHNIQSYLNNVEKVYVLDNTEEPNKKLINKLSLLAKTVYFNDRENKGIAVRLNYASKMAIHDGFEGLLTMDQDSYFNQSDISNIIACISLHANKSEVAMYGVEYVKEPAEKNTCKHIETEQLITSGSIVNLSLFNAVGGFDESLFIDEVDLDYCYNSITKGFKIIKFTNIFLNHSLGKVSYHPSLKDLQSTPRTLHSPLRVYYMIRNFLYVNAKYKNNFSLDKERRKKGLLNRVKNNILYGRNRLLLIRLIFEAFKDYKNNKMGKKFKII